ACTPGARCRELWAARPPRCSEFMACGVAVLCFIGSSSPSAARGAVPNDEQPASEPATFIERNRVSWLQSMLVPNGLAEPRATEKKPFRTSTPFVPPLLTYVSVHFSVPPGLP